MKCVASIQIVKNEIFAIESLFLSLKSTDEHVNFNLYLECTGNEGFLSFVLAHALLLNLEIFLLAMNQQFV